MTMEWLTCLRTVVPPWGGTWRPLLHEGFREAQPVLVTPDFTRGIRRQLADSDELGQMSEIEKPQICMLTTGLLGFL